MRANTKKSDYTKCKNVEQLEFPYVADGTIKWNYYFGNSLTFS